MALRDISVVGRYDSSSRLCADKRVNRLGLDFPEGWHLQHSLIYLHGRPVATGFVYICYDEDEEPDARDVVGVQLDISPFEGHTVGEIIGDLVFGECEDC